jgi:predicted RNase H-like HicB family nuclease
VVAMSPRRTYRVSAERTDRGWWVIRILDFRHVVTQARRAAEIETMARDVIALLEDLPPDSFDLDVTHRVGDDLDAGIAEARRLRREADDLTRRSRETTADVARRLRSAGLSVREIGALLGIAHQRAQQILATGDAAGRR